MRDATTRIPPGRSCRRGSRHRSLAAAGRAPALAATGDAGIDSGPQIVGRHDLSYRLFFSHLRIADLFAIEASQNWQEVWLGVRRLRDSLPPEEADLRRAFETWLQNVILPRFGRGGEDAAALSLEELEPMLADSIDRWNRKIREEGLEEGREEGRDEGRKEVVLRLLRLKFGTLPPEVEERVRAADADRLLRWNDRILTAERLADVFAS